MVVLLAGGQVVVLLAGSSTIGWWWLYCLPTEDGCVIVCWYKPNLDMKWFPFLSRVEAQVSMTQW